MKETYSIKDPSGEYIMLFNAITEATKTLDQLCAALMLAQRCAEELYLSGPEEESHVELDQAS